MFENALDGVLSDRIVVFYDPAAATVGDDVKFCSDPVLSLCNGKFTFHFPDVVETGEFQHVADIFGTDVGSGMYTINARSDFGDTADVPEPAMGLLSGSIVALTVLLRRRRNEIVRR
jgi:hypothetical protein